MNTAPPPPPPRSEQLAQTNYEILGRKLYLDKTGFWTLSKKVFGDEVHNFIFKRSLWLRIMTFCFWLIVKQIFDFLKQQTDLEFLFLGSFNKFPLFAWVYFVSETIQVRNDVLSLNNQLLPVEVLQFVFLSEHFNVFLLIHLLFQHKNITIPKLITLTIYRKQHYKKIKWIT